MPGSSAFMVPLNAIFVPFATTPGTEWHRAVPSAATTINALGAGSIPTGIADCKALEYYAPPTLRTAYDIYSVSIPWGVQLIDLGAAYADNILFEAALLINDQVAWIGSDDQPVAPIPFDANGYFANGVISADLVNPLRLNPRERLSLRLGAALRVPTTVNAGNSLLMAVGGQSGANATMFGVQGTISYQIIDLPGKRSL